MHHEVSQLKVWIDFSMDEGMPGLWGYRPLSEVVGEHEN